MIDEGHGGRDYGRHRRAPAARRRRTGIHGPLPARAGGRGRGRGPAALVRAARLDLGGRAQPPPGAVVADRRLPHGRGLVAARLGPDLRVLGARGMPPARRGLAALRRRDAKRRPALVRRGRADTSAPGRGDPGRDRRSRPARLAPLRRLRRRWDVELEAGEGDARAALEHRPARRRRAPGLPAALRPDRARAAAAGARGARARRGGAPPGARASRGTGAGRAHGRGRRRALAAEGRRPLGRLPRSTASSPRAGSAGSAWTTAAHPCSSPPTPSSTARGRRPPSC